MKINKMLVALSFILAMTSVACEDEVLPDNFTHKYEQTQCADPWGNERDPSELETAVVNYLKDKLIEVVKIKADDTAGDLQACLACTCTSGTTIFIEASDEEGQKLIDLNEGWEAL